MRAKGQDCQFSVYADGVKQATFAAIENAELDMDLQVETMGYGGEAGDRVSQRNGNPSVTMSLHPDSSEYLRLFDYVRRKGLPFDHPEYQTIRIDFSGSFNFGDGGRSRVFLSDCAISDARIGFQSRNDGFVTGNLRATTSADKFRRIA